MMEKIEQLRDLDEVSRELGNEPIYKDIGDLVETMIKNTKITFAVLLLFILQGIVGNAVQGASIYPAAVIAVDDFAHQPEIRLHFLSGAAQLFHKIKVQNVRSVKTDTIHIKFRNPETDHIADIILYLRITLVQLNKKVVSTPVFVGETIVVLGVSAKIDIAIPVYILRMFTVLLDIPECKEITACVVEYAVKDYTDAFVMTCFHKVCKIFVGSKAGVKFLVVCCLIAMSYALKKRTNI